MADLDIEVSLFTNRLPREIRDEIYRYLFLAKNVKCYAEHVNRDPCCAKLWPCSYFRFQSAVLRTNRQIHDEAIKVLYHENLFVVVSSITFNLDDNIAVGGIALLYAGGTGSKAHSFEYCAMSVTLEEDPRYLNVDYGRMYYVIACDDLGSLCQIMLHHDATCEPAEASLPDVHFEVAMRPQPNENMIIEPVSTSAQRRLLEPFTALHSVRKFNISGHVNTDYKNSVVARLSKPAPSVEDTVHRVVTMSREAIKLSDRGYHAQAILKYMSAIVQTFTKNRYLTPKTVLETGLLGGRTEMFAFNYLHFMLRCKIAMCHAKLNDWKEAHFWICDAMGIEFFPIELAELVYLVAWVLNAESSESVQNFERLVESLDEKPTQSYWHQDLSELEEKMRSKEGMDSLRNLQVMMEGLADRDWVGGCE